MDAKLKAVLIEAVLALILVFGLIYANETKDQLLTTDVFFVWGTGNVLLGLWMELTRRRRS